MTPLHRGDTRTLKVTITDDAGAAIDISGHSLWVTFKQSRTDADVDAVLQASAVLPSDASTQAGIGTVTIPSSATDDLTPGRYYYDIQWVQPGSPPVVKTIQSGRVRVLYDITVSVS